MTNFSRFSRWTAACAVVIALGWPLGAHAYTFSLVGDGSGQRLSWFWETCATNCTSSITNPCGNVFSTNGSIPWTFDGAATFNRSGGMLNWTSSPGVLSVVAMPVAAALSSQPTSCAGRWAVVDAREIPLVFSLVPGAGDPFPLLPTLHVLPRLTGTVSQFTGAGGYSDLWLQFMMAVFVDGHLVSRDSLYGTFTLTDGADSVRQLELPKGALNSSLFVGAAAGSEITIYLWTYMRVWVTGSANTSSTSSFGEGPAIEILIRDENAVDVSDEIALPRALSLAARPNPSAGPCRVQYDLPQRSPVRLTAYDLRGRRVATLVDRSEEAGSHQVTWDGRGARGERLAAGVYVLELMAGSERRVGKVALLGR